VKHLLTVIMVVRSFGVILVKELFIQTVLYIFNFLTSVQWIFLHALY